ncbi:hypothetical protein HQ520_11755, partial [bacterium]|nr:hypothetical protein [bacterium]
LQDLSLFKPSQTLGDAGSFDVATAQGTAALRGIYQIGQGVLPIHYLLDDQGRLQIMTQQTTAWVLKEAE